MKKFITGIVLGGVLFGGIPAIANSIMAELSKQPIYVDGQKADMTAYTIGGNNYVRLRDIGKAVNFNVTYEAETNSVKIDSTAEYVEEQTMPVQIPSEEKIPISEKILDGSEWSREDFSLQANQSIFDDVYTRGAYNALRQTIVDIDIILSNNNDEGFNAYYKYANYIGSQETRNAINSVLGNFTRYYDFLTGFEPYVKNIYDYPDYRICKPSLHNFFKPANDATDSFIKEVNSLYSDREKVVKLNSYLCDKLTYGNGEETSINTIFTSDVPIKGICGDYAMSFSYLCQRANIPCILIKGENHAWNIVYVDGKWLYVDATGNDTGDDPIRREVMLLTETFKKQDENPKRTAFAKEILIPNSTK